MWLNAREFISCALAKDAHGFEVSKLRANLSRSAQSISSVECGFRSGFKSPPSLLAVEPASGQASSSSLKFAYLLRA